MRTPPDNSSIAIESLDPLVLNINKTTLPYRILLICDPLALFQPFSLSSSEEARGNVKLARPPGEVVSIL